MWEQCEQRQGGIKVLSMCKAKRIMKFDENVRFMDESK